MTDPDDPVRTLLDALDVPTLSELRRLVATARQTESPYIYVKARLCARCHVPYIPAANSTHDGYCSNFCRTHDQEGAAT